MHQVVYINKLEHKHTLIPLDPRLLYIGPYMLRDTCPELYSCLPVLRILCVLCLAAYLATVCTMQCQCQAASNAYYAAFSIAYVVFILFCDHVY